MVEKEKDPSRVNGGKRGEPKVEQKKLTNSSSTPPPRQRENEKLI